VVGRMGLDGGLLGCGLGGLQLSLGRRELGGVVGPAP
jgi:hypothetical protein